MILKSVILTLLLALNFQIGRVWCQFDSEQELIDWLAGTYETFASNNCKELADAEWAYATDVANADKAAALTEKTLEVAEKRKEYWETYFEPLDISDYESEALRRQLTSLKNLGNAALDPADLEELSNIQRTMTNLYSTAKICPYENQECDVETEGLPLEPRIEEILATSEDYDELVYAWKAWRDASGAKIGPVYGDYIRLSNMAAQANDFEDTGDMWRSRYETENFIENLDELWEQVKPLYDELHLYVLNKLKEKYGDNIDTSDGLIPANILGNMWAQSWVNIEKYVRPYPEASEVDVTDAMLQAGYKVLEMFEKSNEFYMSMGLLDNSVSYQSDSMIEKPEGIEVLCHASAWDFCDGDTFRIKMCTNVDMEDFVTVHHEMGHIQYYLQYKDLPISFRGGANPGFHEAIGDTIALSVATPQHLEEIGLLTGYEDNYKASINALMNMALERVAFLPFGLLIDKWRWDVFSGNVEENEWNDHWWYYRQLYQKVKSPVERTEGDFDPGAKYHVAGNSQYINYFVAHILEFQLYRSLCITAGEYQPDDPGSKPLHKCDFYTNEDAGTKLSDGLSLGSSRHWSVALEAMTGETELDATAIMEYFAPLYTYLRMHNQNKLIEEELQELLSGKYAEEAQQVYTSQVHAEWNYATDVKDETAEAQNEATLTTAKFDKDYWTDVFQYLDEEDYQDETLRRQVQFLKVLGDAALEEEKLSQLTGAISSMTNIYSTAAICPYDNQECDFETEGLQLDPGIERIISTSDDYPELLYAWEAWREVSGALMKEDFATYVRLSNEAAVLNDFSNKGEMWRNSFESSTFVEDLDELWDQVEPLYDALQFYVSRKLKSKYGDDLDLSDRLIPAHVLGNMWAQSWINLASIVKPYPDVSPVDISQALNDEGWTVDRMFEEANDFYISIGLDSCNMSYGEESMIVRPEDKEVVCHASAWDFYDQATYRVKMCTQVNYEDLVTIHHELGHIEYYLLYEDQPITLRTGANPGFHEAVGDTIALSVATPQHFRTMGLLPDYEDSKEADINSLMDMALERVAFLPFGLLIDKWRWDVFEGVVPEEEWNDHWWYYRETIQKVKAPVERSSSAFDPGAKFHVAADYQYISYFVAHILEFQFFKALCIEAGQYNEETKDPPLHRCDYFDNKEAGQKLRDALQWGAAKPWEDILEILTDQREMDASAILEYFAPLYEYLQKQNRNIPENELVPLIRGDYERAAIRAFSAQSYVEWQFDIDMAGGADNLLQTTLATTDFQRNWHEIFRYLNEESYDEDISQQLRLLKTLGDGVLSNEELSEFTSVVTELKRHQSSAIICPFEAQGCTGDAVIVRELSLQTALLRITDYDELLYYFEEWRAVSGSTVDKNAFARYVQLANGVAVANGFANRGEQWRSQYEVDNFVNTVDNLWSEVEPLYDFLHEFVSKRLKEHYEDQLDIEDELIPAHVLGSIWGESWWNLTWLVRPYPNANAVDVTIALWDNEISSGDGIVRQAEQFFQSLQLEATGVADEPDNIYGASINSGDMSYYPTSWDLYDQSYRVKFYAAFNTEGYTLTHRMLTHIQYYMLYKDQLTTYRKAPNPAFYDAVGGAFALSARSPKHLEELGLIEDFEHTEETDLNILMDVALDILPKLPFALVVDKWRWDVFSGATQQSQWNSRWWHYRETLQKVKSPITRSESDFDAATVYNVMADEPQINTFIANIMQFQILKALCIEAGQYDIETKDPPLHRCTFYGSSEVGNLLKEALSVGSTQHWSEVLNTLTGETEISTDALMEYFEPLYEYLERGGSAVVTFSVVTYVCSFFFVYFIPRLLW